MNFRIVANQLGLLLLVLSGIMCSIAAFSGAELLWASDAEGERVAFRALATAAGTGIVIGAALLRLSRRSEPDQVGRREAMLLVALSWFVGAALAGAPYWAWAQLSGLSEHPFASPVNCYFEAMSGLTTTGATILTEIETVPRSLLLWRALTHWLGGLGIVVLFVAVLPAVGVVGKKLFNVEATGAQHEGVKPHIRETARVLWYIYAGLTCCSIVAYRVAGMGWFDSICHAFSVISTGGLSTRDASIAYYDSVAIDIVTIIFMLIAGVNFALFYQMVQGRFRSAWKDVELHVYLALKVAVTLIIAVNLMRHPTIVTTAGKTLDPATTGELVRHATFTTVALQTGTGFGTADYDLWPYLSRALLLVLFFVGGCAGSTAGGVKVIRVWIATKVLAAELERAFRPQVVRPIRIANSAVPPEMQQAAVVYIGLFLVLFTVGSIAVQLAEPADGRCDGPTAISASLSCLCNVGPGIHEVGARRNYEWFTDTSKVILAILMALGRLEIFAILVLLSPRFWRRT